MKFTLAVRMVQGVDLNSSTPFLPDQDEYEIHLDALRDELALIEAVSTVARCGSTFDLVTTRRIPTSELKALIKPVFMGSVAMNLRYLSLVET